MELAKGYTLQATGKMRWFTDNPNKSPVLQQEFIKIEDYSARVHERLWKDVPLVCAPTGGE